MRRMLLLVVGLSLPLGVSATARPKARAAVTAVAADLVLDERNPDPDRRAELLLIAGWSPSRGWLSGEQLKGAMPRNARLSLYNLTRGSVGEAQTLGDDRAMPATSDELPLIHGVEVGAKLVRLDMPAEEGVLAAWQAPGAAPLRWVKARKLDADAPPYRLLASDWLLSKKVPKSVIDAVQIESVLAADINRDGREEVFLAFGTLEHRMHLGAPDGPTRTEFSYLIMQYLPRDSRQPAIKVVAQSVPFDYEIRGFCDLNGDGWADIIARDHVTDYVVSAIYHWNGRRFERTEGWSFSV